MTTEAIAGLIFGFVSVIGVFITGTWVLSNKINSTRDSLSAELASTRSELNAKISMLEQELAVMKQREDNRGEKLDQMWRWWLKTIENGWMAHMKAVAGDTD